jgi:hypothetical protein
MTVRLPLSVYERARSLVEKAKQEGAAGSGPNSLNDFFTAAITAYLKMYERRQIDAAFAGMADDAGYQKEAQLLAQDFQYSDWEALRLDEKDLEEEPGYGATLSR